jgi:FixJ family two-component response regulator
VSSPTTGPLVACVDDDLSVRQAVENLLASAGIGCETFESAEEFLSSGALARATCLLVDVWMGGMSGLELQREVRVTTPQVPIIFMSAQRDEATRSTAFAEGARAFLDKPFKVDTLIDAVRRVLGERGA